VTYSRDTRYGQTRRGRADTIEQGFTCRHCGLYVTCAPSIAGVRNRNHCPYCLWSRHLDWRIAGDRLAGCRATMRPVGLTTKHSRNKYASDRDGELMLIHRCTVCAKVAINRIAADDNTPAIFALFEDSSYDSAVCQSELDGMGVSMLTAHDIELVRRRLFGNRRVGGSC
jgi:RNHCP domain